MTRYNQGNYLQRFGKLYEQYMVIQAAKMEADRLAHLRFQQPKLRTELYSGLEDMIVRGDADVANVGRQVILPSTLPLPPKCRGLR